MPLAVGKSQKTISKNIKMLNIKINKKIIILKSDNEKEKKVIII